MSFFALQDAVINCQWISIFCNCPFAERIIAAPLSWFLKPGSQPFIRFCAFHRKLLMKPFAMWQYSKNVLIGAFNSLRSMTTCSYKMEKEFHFLVWLARAKRFVLEHLNWTASHHFDQFFHLKVKFAWRNSILLHQRIILWN